MAPLPPGSLCRRFAGWAPAEVDGDEGRIDLPLGPCHLSAMPESLALVVEAEDEDEAHDLAKETSRTLPMSEWDLDYVSVDRVTEVVAQ